MFDILPDIHGQIEKLTSALTRLGYRDRAGAWRHSDPNRRVLFLGDFVDRGPGNAAVISLVRRMLDAGTAYAVMGNHELNAIHFHTIDPETGAPLRPNTQKNIDQHVAFLRDFPVGEARTLDAISWMQELPLFLDLGPLRIVHACWHGPTIAALEAELVDGRLTEDLAIRAGRKDDPLNDLVEITTKGPEFILPKGEGFTDPDGIHRDRIRLKWWNRAPSAWIDLAASVHDESCLPQSPLPDDVPDYTYPVSEKPVFFGHYWFRGTPVLQSANTLCLDYSAGLSGPLLAYRHSGAAEPIDLAKIVTGWAPEDRLEPDLAPG